jgi:glutathione synthase/RimK-type ligase-like ATP-grasp enzyme
MAKIAIFTERYTIRDAAELTALTNFRMAAFDLGHQLDFIFKNELKYLGNYDAVFLRALTDPLNTTYVVARLAELRGMRVLDHAESIRICCDKVNMYSRLMRQQVSLPDTTFLQESELTEANASELFETMGLPLVLKAPNSSFSAYVEKVNTPADFVRIGKKFLRRADRIIVQQYMPSDFDWRVITLAGQVIAVLKYLFVQDKWKLMERGSGGEWAKVVGIPLEQVDPRLLKVALQAADAIGQSLYGIDIKEVAGEYYVIEVNDNPTIAAGEEDSANPEIYSLIIRYLAGR